MILAVGKKAVPPLGATNSSLWLWVPAFVFAGTTVSLRPGWELLTANGTSMTIPLDRALYPPTLPALRRGRRDRALAAHLAACLSRNRLRGARAVVARALAQRTCAECRDHRRGAGGQSRGFRDDRWRRLSRPARGRARALGLESWPTHSSTRRSCDHPKASRCWSTRTTPARSASMNATVLVMPAMTSIQHRAGRCCVWRGRHSENGRHAAAVVVES